MTLPLTKTLDPERDYVELAPELAVVDPLFQSAREQHPHRRFEYALALRAWRTWRALQPWPRPFSYDSAIDVGGAGSPFASMLVADCQADEASIVILDPDVPVLQLQFRPASMKLTLQQHLQLAACLTHAVFCLSVLEHVDDLDRFLFHLACLVAPGGLLFLTMDCREDRPLAEGEHDWPPQFPVDDRHYHWMRQRIFTPRIVSSLVPFHFGSLGFGYFGDVDLAYHDHQLFGSYSFASLALIKRA